MKLVIVESPTKEKTIVKYLGKDYKVVSSLGHIRDLSTSGKFGFGVDLEDNFKPNYEIIKGKMDDVFLNVTGKKISGGIQPGPRRNNRHSNMEFNKLYI